MTACGHLEGMAGQLELLDRVQLTDVAVGADEAECPFSTAELSSRRDCPGRAASVRHVQPALGLVQAGPAAGAGVLPLRHRTGGGSAADRPVAPVRQGVDRADRDRPRYDATSSFVQVASGLTLTSPNASSQLTIGAAARVGASTLLSEVSQARLPCTAWRSGAHLAELAALLAPAGMGGRLGPGLGHGEVQVVAGADLLDELQRLGEVRFGVEEDHLYSRCRPWWPGR